MSDRLQELLRQRALLQEHLAWLESEIVAAAEPGAQVAKSARTAWPDEDAFINAPPTPADPPSPTPGTGPLPAAKSEPPEVSAAADAIIDEYRVPPGKLHTDVKKGCLVYLFAAFGAVALAVIAFYFAYHHG